MDNTQFDPLFKEYAEKYGLDWLKLKAQAMAESNLDPTAISPHGAEGIAQFLPATFAEQAHKLGIQNPDVFDPNDAIHAQAGYMAYLTQKTGDWTKALAAYNWGLRHVTHLLDQVGDGDWMNHLPAETHAYIRRIIAYLGGN